MGSPQSRHGSLLEVIETFLTYLSSHRDFYHFFETRTIRAVQGFQAVQVIWSKTAEILNVRGDDFSGLDLEYHGTGTCSSRSSNQFPMR